MEEGWDEDKAEIDAIGVYRGDCGNAKVSCNPKEQTTMQKLTNRQTTKKPTRKMAHLVFSDTRANAQKTKRAIFLPTL